MGIPIVVYTHTDYSDVYDIFFETQNKFGLGHPIITFTNKFGAQFMSDRPSVIYDDKLPYRDRVISCLEQSPELDTFLFCHEDFLLYREPDAYLLSQYHKLVANGEAGIIKLIRCGEMQLNPIYKGWGGPWSFLHQIGPDSEHQFAIQASIIRRETLLHLFKGCNSMSIWDLETELAHRAVSEFRLEVFYHWNGEPQRGLVHTDSNVYPYMATAVVKGKWNHEYAKEIITLVPNDKILARGWTQ